MQRWMIMVLVGILLFSIVLPFETGGEELDFDLYGFATFSLKDWTNSTMDLRPQYSTFVSNNALYKTYTEQTAWFYKEVTRSETRVDEGKRTDFWHVDLKTYEKVTFLGSSGNISEQTMKVHSTGFQLYGQDEHYVHSKYQVFNTLITTVYKEGEEHDISYYEHIEIRDSSQTPISGGPVFPISIGDTWTEENSFTSNFEFRQREWFDEEPVPEFNVTKRSGSGTSTRYFKAEKFMDAEGSDGLVKTMSIKNWIPDEDEYMIEYYNRDGVQIREEFYEKGGPLYKTYILDEYRIYAVGDDDNDGVLNYLDEYPQDPERGLDSDKDGVPDEEDDYPDNPVFASDTDEDGYPDRINIGKEEEYGKQELMIDEFPNDAADWKDTDDDGIGDNTDSFPLDVAASVDSDHDGYPDEWNPKMNQEDSTSGLELDLYPNDPMRALPEKTDDLGGIDTTVWIAIGMIIVLTVVILLGLGITYFLVLRRK